MAEIKYRIEERYKVGGICMDGYNNMGTGFLEIVYKVLQKLRVLN